MKCSVRNLSKFVQMKYRAQGVVPLLDMFTPVVVSKKAFSSVFIPSPAHKLNKHYPRAAVSELRKQEIITSLLASDISLFLHEKEILRLKPFLKRKSNPCIDYCFVIDCAVAQDIVNKILTKVNLKESTVIEGNPGLGLISLCLFKSGVREIHFYDQSILVPLSLKQILQVYCDGKVNLTSCNLFMKFREHCSEILKVINTRKSELQTIIIGVVPNYSCISSMVWSLVAYNLWNTIDLTEFYFVISLDMHNKILKFKNYKGKYYTYCMYNFIFETEVMAEYPREAFLPFSCAHHDKMYLIRIKKRGDIFARISEKDLWMYSYFLKIIGRSSHSFIIPTLEQWLPDCGPYLISKGISLANQTKDLPFSESVKLFEFIKQFDGYENFCTLSRNIDGCEGITM